MDSDKEKNTSSDEIDFNEDDLEVVEISDDAIENADQDSKKARKLAKKESKKHLTPEEKKSARRKKDFIALGILILTLAVLLAVPFTRWPLLNAIGFRGNVILTVHEVESNKPITGVNVSLLNGQSSVTDSYGRAKLSSSKLGKQKVTLSKTGYGTVTKEVTVHLGNTKIDYLKLKVIGIKLDVNVKDWLSGRVLGGATVSYDKTNATSDSTGLASIVIPPTDEQKVKLDVSANGYITKTIETDINVTSREVALVASAKDYFISKRDGKFDIFSSNLDGSGQSKIIEATGKESQGLMQFSIISSNQQAVLIANRDGIVKNNRIVAGVYVIDLLKSTLKKVDEGSDIRLLNWVGNSFVYSKTSPDLNYNDPNFSQLITYDVSKSKSTLISQSNYFQISLVAQNKVFYLPTDPYRTIENSVLSSFDVNNGSRRTYLESQRLSYASRVSYSTIEIQDNTGKNYELQIASGAVKNIDRQPGSNLIFFTKQDGSKVLWTDKRDGQGALLIKSTGANDEKIVTKIGGMSFPVRLIDDYHAVVRIVTSQETADYVVDIETGKLAKIVDVSDIEGNQRSEF